MARKKLVLAGSFKGETIWPKTYFLSRFVSARRPKRIVVYVMQHMRLLLTLREREARSL